MPALPRNAIRSLFVAVLASVVLFAVPGASAAAGELQSPRNISPPTVSGESELGSTLTCSPGEWEGNPEPTYSYRWERWEYDFEVPESRDPGEVPGRFFAIDGANGPTYTTEVEDLTYKSEVRCDVTATNSVGSWDLHSQAVKVTSAPIITYGPKVVGHRLGGAIECEASAVGNPRPEEAFQWLLDGVPWGEPSVFPRGSFSWKQVGHEVSCQATFRNRYGSVSATSAPVELTSGPEATKGPSISGTAQIGGTLACSPGEWRAYPEPISFSYQWEREASDPREGKDIEGANAPTYAPVAADGEHWISCVVTATSKEGSSSYSSQRVTVQTLPANVSPPVIGGTPLIGHTATCSTGEWTGLPSPEFSYRWMRDGAAIEGAEGSSYEPTAADAEHRISCEVTATNAIGAVSAVSEAAEIPTTPAAPVDLIAPRISGSPHYGVTLTCEPGEWTGSPKPTYSYQWERDGIPITEQHVTSNKSTWEPFNDWGHELTCVVTATNPVGSASVSSAAVIPSLAACGGGPILGQGSSLQGSAQTELWGPAAGGYNGLCGEKQVQYTVSPGGKALAAWGFQGGAFQNTDAFIATDEAPSAAQIEATKKNILTIPVAQTAIAIPVNPPTNCTITEITNKQLEGVMRGTIKIWNKLQTATGTGCTNAPVTRVVAKEGSGTTYQAKNYLSKISEASLTCLPAGVKTPTWRGTEEIGANAAEEPNTLWPEDSAASGCTNQVTAIVRGEGDAGVVKKVNVTEGSIGYAALPDVEKNKNKGENPHGDTHWIKVQDNGVSNKLSVAKFASPAEAGNSANCFETQYPVPAKAEIPALPPEQEYPKAWPGNADWSQIFGGNTKAASISPGAYPLCALTYIEALYRYSGSGFSLEAEKTVRDYVYWYLTEAGQEALEVGGRWYAPLPEGTRSFDVLGAAKFAAREIGY